MEYAVTIMMQIAHGFLFKQKQNIFEMEMEKKCCQFQNETKFSAPFGAHCVPFP